MGIYRKIVCVGDKSWLNHFRGVWKFQDQKNAVKGIRSKQGRTQHHNVIEKT